MRSVGPFVSDAAVQAFKQCLFSQGAPLFYPLQQQLQTSPQHLSSSDTPPRREAN